MKRKMFCALCAALFFLSIVSTALADESIQNFYIGIPDIVGGTEWLEKDPAFQQAVERFGVAHPDLRVRLSAARFPLLAAELRNASTDYALILGFSEDLQALYAENLLANVQSDGALAANLESWPDLSAFTAEDGAVVAVPWRVRLATMRTQAESLEKVGADLPEAGWTWDDFFALGDTLLTYNETSPAPYGLITEGLVGFPFPYCFSQYVENARRMDTPAFSTPAFRALLEGSKRMRDAGLATTPRDAESGCQNLFRLTHSTRNDGFGVPVPLPVFAPDIRPGSAVVDAIMVPAHSRVLPLALEFLSYLTDPTALMTEARKDAYIASGLVLKGEDAFFAALDERFPGIALPTAEETAFWQIQYESALPHAAGMLAQETNALVSWYLDGEITLAECMDALEALLYSQPT